jgi:hypothetical protein
VGSEARNGSIYDGAISIGDDACSVYVFAECDGLEQKRVFQFPAKGNQDVIIVKEKPAQLYSVRPKRLDNSTKTYDGLKFAKERGISFEEVSLTIGAGRKVINLTLGELKIPPEFLEEELQHLQKLFGDENPAVIMSFKKANTPTGFDLEQFVKETGIELANDEVIQE